MLEQIVFVSSPVYGQEQLRRELYDLISAFRGPGGLRFRCLLSERPDFPRGAHVITRHSYDICMRNVQIADYVVLALNKRYGHANLPDEQMGDVISITHAEFREAFRFRKPIITLVHKKTWNAAFAHRSGKRQAWVPPGQLGIFSLIEEIRKLKRNNWINQYSTKRDIQHIIKSSLFEYDNTAFIGDVTIPDGTTVETGDVFEKVWELRNAGTRLWEGRFLRHETHAVGALMPPTETIPLPNVSPGQSVRVRVVYKVGSYPRTAHSYWKMYSVDNKLCFPNHVGLCCDVVVEARVPNKTYLSLKHKKRPKTRALVVSR